MTERSGRPGVVLHTLLEERGGATRVADLLVTYLPQHGFTPLHSFEAAETESGQRRLKREPWSGALLRQGRAATVMHLHSTADWPTLLALVAPLIGRIVLTLHDESLLTGGCTYALNCDELERGCSEPCPRNFSGCAHAFAIRNFVSQLRPLLVSPSRWLKERTLRVWPEAKVRVVPNGVEWPDRPPDKSAAKAALGFAAEARVVLFAAHGGQGAAYKAVGDWLSIWQRIKAQEPRAAGVMLGGDTTGQQGDLHLWPYLDRTRMDLVLAAADVLAYPSLADNHPLLVLEAMARATPVVASAVGGIPEQLEDGRTGLLARNFTTLAELTAQLLAHPGQLRALGLAGFEHGAVRFTAGRMAGDYAALYAKLKDACGGVAPHPCQGTKLHGSMST